MSARDAMAAMLDELMGPKRNVDLGKDTTVKYDDPDVCKYYIAGFCPHDMFVNTKADLGPCPKLHDDNLRISYPESKEFEKLGFERDFLRFLTRLEEENQRRIKKNKDKLRSNDEYGQKKDEERKQKLDQDLAQIDADIKKAMDDAEEAGNKGEVGLSHELVGKVESLERSKAAFIERMALEHPEIDDGVRPKDVCEVCGSILIRNDAPNRVEEHLSGKMHVGFAKIQATIKEFEVRMKKKQEEIEKERKARKRSTEKDRKRSRSRDRRDRDRDNRSSRNRSRSRENRPRHGRGDRDRTGSDRERGGDRDRAGSDRERGGDRDRAACDRDKAASDRERGDRDRDRRHRR